MMIVPGCLFLVSFFIVSEAHLTTVSTNTDLTCTFEYDDICGFEQLTDDDIDWTRHRGKTPTVKTGPSGDHTTGTGFYMYLDTSDETISKARLASPFQNATNQDGICLDFYYHMYGYYWGSIGTLNVIVASDNLSFPGDLIFTISSSQGNRWWQASVHFNSPSSQWRIIFEGLSTSSIYGNIAIDDVSFIPGPCPTQAPLDQHWTTESFHDLTPTPWGDIQEIRLVGGSHLEGIIEVLYNGEWGTVCTYGSWGGYDNGGVACRQLGFESVYMSGNAGSRYETLSDRIWMSGVKCNGQESSLSECPHDGFGPNSCSHSQDAWVLCRDYAIPAGNTTCTFEHDTCNFYNMVDDDFDWSRHQGSTLSTDTGPSGDHTTGTGYYMYAETSSGTIGWKARLASNAYNETDYEGLCLSFYYHMYGSSVGTLNVILGRGSEFDPSADEVIFTVSGDNGNRWRQASAHFSEYSYYHTSQWRIVFEVIRGSSYTGDIAIDDVSFTPGPCPTQEPSEEDVVLRCASSSFQVDIPENLIEDTYFASDFYLSGDPDDPSCKGFYNGAGYISLNSSLTACGTQYYENGTQLLYRNMVEINPSDGNDVVDFLGVEIPITCEYNSSKKVQTHFKTLNDVIRKQEKGSFEFDFAMYTDITYSTRYYSYPVEAKLNEELYFRAELLRSASNLEIHLRSCRATPSPNYDDAVLYEFISAGCGINNAPVRVLTPNMQTQADFEITSFRFRKDLSHPDSQIWIHCEVVVCDVSDSNSECRQGCEQSRHRRSAESSPLKTKRMVQGPIVLSRKDNDNSDKGAMSGNNDGISGVFTTFLSALSLVMLMGLVVMGVALTKVIRSSKKQGYQPLPNPANDA